MTLLVVPTRLSTESPILVIRCQRQAGSCGWHARLAFLGAISVPDGSYLADRLRGRAVSAEPRTLEKPELTHFCRSASLDFCFCKPPIGASVPSLSNLGGANRRPAKVVILHRLVFFLKHRGERGRGRTCDELWVVVNTTRDDGSLSENFAPVWRSSRSLRTMAAAGEAGD